MRTSRGLRITSLIVVSPVILILISLVAILAMAVQSQIKAWYFAAVSTLPPHQPFFNEPSAQFINARSFSRLASTAFVFSYNHPAAQLPASLDASSRVDAPKVTAARRILPRLKRLLPSSTWLGVLTVFALITLQKVSEKNCSTEKIMRKIFLPLKGTSAAAQDDRFVYHVASW